MADTYTYIQKVYYNAVRNLQPDMRLVVRRRPAISRVAVTVADATVQASGSGVVLFLVHSIQGTCWTHHALTRVPRSDARLKVSAMTAVVKAYMQQS